MLDWQNYYRDRIRTPSEAVKYINSGQRVILGHACGEPQVLTRALVARAHELEDVEIVQRVAMGESSYVGPEMQGHFKLNSLFGSAPTRKAIADGRADFTPCFICEIPGLFLTGKIPLDVAMITVTPPDSHGYCSLGISIDYTIQAARAAKMVIAQVNPEMPRTYGDTLLHVSEIDYFVPAEEPLIVLDPPVIGPVEKQIGMNVASLIDDGSTLQLGIGSIPDAILSFLHEKHDLGVHTELFSDGVRGLVEAGVINGKKKTLHPGKVVANFVMGTPKLYNWVHNNPAIYLYPEDYVNDPFVVARNYRMIAINSALEVDVLGQVAADMLGPRQFSGVGGQVDFIRGAARSPGGKAIIAFPATAMKGKASRIVSVLTRGAAVTTSRHDVEYVVTEYGIASLKAKTVKERIEALISIAHPDFRAEIRKDAYRTYFML
ncbi:MAG TPA: 4-hydroxybutyrate CoA-transferase [Syntrophomonas sp.]|nr:4-hydroxybutyrate CoA-transferase [Syntrophomonas sp.]